MDRWMDKKRKEKMAIEYIYADGRTDSMVDD